MRQMTLVELLVVACLVAILGAIGLVFWSETQKPPCLEHGPPHLVMVPQKIGNVTHMQQHWVRSCIRREEGREDG